MIEIHNLTKRFGKFTALDRVSLAMSAGRCTAVIGPNGSGKSTMIKCLLGLATPTEGRITIGGTPLNGDCSYRKDIGYMPQLARFPQDLKSSEVMEMIVRLRGDAISAEPLYDLSAESHKRVRTLSGGNRQKLSAVIATMFKPNILILDEPTAGLDPIASHRLKDYLQAERKRGTTIVLTSHILSELEELADDIIFLLEGKVRFAGGLGQLREMTGETRLSAAIARVMESNGK
ncbi:MAG: ABC transporter ATP-binding protein [candidate division Zixibacteria bacterium]|nr:ABC transporter ATP-binding protein [candidate division Zixibacteria bacterium]